MVILKKRKLSICFSAILAISLIGLTAACLAPGEAPTIELEIYDGPDYSESDNMCYYRVEATATGMPEPEIEFDGDDNINPLGSRRVEVGVEIGDTYTLTAAAKNITGSATASIMLAGKCGETGDEMADIETDDEVVDIGADDETIDSDTDDETNDKEELSKGTEDKEAGEVEIADSEPVDIEDAGEAEEAPITDDETVLELVEVPSVMERYDPNLVYDFIDEAPNADWQTNRGYIDFGGELNDDRGFATYRYDITLEDGLTYSKVLETHPAWIDDGSIMGWFLGVSIPAEGARFTAKVGFIDGLTRTDGVRVGIWFYEEGGDSWNVFGHRYYNDGVLDIINIDLDPYAGKTGIMQLYVDAEGTSTQDWFVWVNPKIVR
jgi:hypothetical protein